MIWTHERPTYFIQNQNAQIQTLQSHFVRSESKKKIVNAEMFYEHFIQNYVFF